MPLPRCQKVCDTPTDQNPNEMVVKRPSRPVVTRESKLDKAHRVVDHGSGKCERMAAFVICKRERQLRLREPRPPKLHVSVAHRIRSATQHIQRRREANGRIIDSFASDSGRRSSPEIRPQRLPVVPAQILSMVSWEDQHALTQAITRKDSKAAPIEVHAKRFTGLRFGQAHVFRSRPQNQRDQRRGSSRPSRSLRDETCQPSWATAAVAEQSAGRGEPFPAVPEPAVGLHAR